MPTSTILSHLPNDCTFHGYTYWTWKKQILLKDGQKMQKTYFSEFCQKIGFPMFYICFDIFYIRSYLRFSKYSNTSSIYRFVISRTSGSNLLIRKFILTEQGPHEAHIWTWPDMIIRKWPADDAKVTMIQPPKYDFIWFLYDSIWFLYDSIWFLYDFICFSRDFIWFLYDFPCFYMILCGFYMIIYVFSSDFIWFLYDFI